MVYATSVSQGIHVLHNDDHSINSIFFPESDFVGSWYLCAYVSVYTTLQSHIYLSPISMHYPALQEKLQDTSSTE